MTHDTEVQVHDPDPPRAKRGGPMNSPWRDEKICKRVKALWANHTASQIANKVWIEFQVEISRNSVVGFLHREKLTVEQKSEVHPMTRNNGAGRPRVRRTALGIGIAVQKINAAVHNINAAKASPKIKAEPFVMACVEVVPLNRTFEELQESECRFVFGDGPFTFCGLPKTEGSSYCAPHKRLCCVGVPQRRGGVSPTEFGKSKGGVFGRVA